MRLLLGFMALFQRQEGVEARDLEHVQYDLGRVADHHGALLRVHPVLRRAPPHVALNAVPRQRLGPRDGSQCRQCETNESS